jgi:hypothetical protein
MPKEGFKSITISEGTQKELSVRAEKEGLSVPQLVEQYMTKAHSLNDLLYLNDSKFVQARIDQIVSIFEGAITSHRIREMARERKQLFLDGKVDSEEQSPYTPEEETQRYEEGKEVMSLATEIAQAIISKDRETYEEFKKQEFEKDRESLTKEREDLLARAERIEKMLKGELNG